jgi:hypothetical protein
LWNFFSSARDICNSYGHPISGNRIDLVGRHGTNPEARLPQTDMERLVRAWFMKPFARKHCLRLGSIIDYFFVNAMRNIDLFDVYLKVDKGPYKFGLVRREDKLWLATSVDGMLDLNMGGIVHPCVMK